MRGLCLVCTGVLSASRSPADRGYFYQPATHTHTHTKKGTNSFCPRQGRDLSRIGHRCLSAASEYHSFLFMHLPRHHGAPGLTHFVSDEAENGKSRKKMCSPRSETALKSEHASLSLSRCRQADICILSVRLVFSIFLLFISICLFFPSLGTISWGSSPVGLEDITPSLTYTESFPPCSYIFSVFAGRYIC